jgi:FkbM family methyltransferase
MFSELKFNVDLNNLSNICILNNVAVSNREGSARLSKYEAGSEVYGSIGRQDWDGWGKSIVGYEEVKVISLDKYIKERNIGHVDLIKIDIEGAELLALQGAYKLLQKSDVTAIVLEMSDVTTNGFGYKAMEIWDYLKNFGYSLYSFDKHGNLAGPAKRPLDFVRAQNLVAISDATLT